MGADFSHADLSNAVLETLVVSTGLETRPEEAVSFVAANLSGAKVTARFSLDDMREAKPFSSSRLALLLGTGRRADFSRANLTGANFEGAALAHVNFEFAKLQHTNFSGADLSDADFAGADLTNADLTGANIARVDFNSAVLTGAKGLPPH